MTKRRAHTLADAIDRCGRPAAVRAVVAALCVLMLSPFDLWAAYTRRDTPQAPGADTAPAVTAPAPADSTVYIDAMVAVPADTADSAAAPGRVVEQPDTVMTVVVDEKSPYGLDGKIPFNPSPERAVWLSALFPGLGQIYNRRYWKLPIIVGGFMGLAYGCNWNNIQYRDYTQGYRDLLDNDPSTRSYMNFFPPNTDESSLDREWLSNIMKNRKDYYRRNRDLCIIVMVGLYLLCMVDAYVDASMAHFDISPDLSMDIAPAVITGPQARRPALGLNWAFTF